MHVVGIMLACSSSNPRSPVVVETHTPAIANGHVAETVGIETLGGVFTPLLTVGCKTPCISRETFSTAADNQDQITIGYFRGDAQLVTDAHFLGRYRLEGIPAMQRGEPQIEVVLTADGDQLTVEATDTRTKQPILVIREP
jgi:molecular chaperone DnaK (HSP70)